MLQRTLFFLICSTSLVFGDDVLPYNEALAKKLLVVSAAAYSDEPWTCLQNHFDQVQVVKEIRVECGQLFDHDCYAFVALLHTRKAIAIAFRGTSSKLQLLREAASAVGPKVEFLEDMGRINRYFHHVHRLIFEQLENFVEELKQKYDYKLWVTGHSLGGALASLATATYMKRNYTLFNETTMENYSFGQPRVGEVVFAQKFKDLAPNYVRVTHAQDPVSYLFPRRFGYRHFPNEVWYKYEMQPSSNYTICRELSDVKCREYKYRDRVEDHRYYFGVHVARYGKAGCPPLNLNTTDEQIIPTSVTDLKESVPATETSFWDCISNFFTSTWKWITS